MSDLPTEWVATCRGGLKADITARGHHLNVDEPAEVGGEDTGPMPTELLTASLASCFCLALAWSATKKGIDLPDLTVGVTAIRAGKEPRYGKYEISVRSSLPDDTFEPLVERAKRFCWVTNTLANPPEVAYEVISGA